MALLAIGSSGLTGHGMGVNLVDIPEAQTDFIFAVIGQSWGLIGTVFIVILCAALDLYLCRIATACENMFEKYIVIGVLGILIYQQFQNIGMVIGLLPITGITLPLISYGGSSNYFLHDSFRYNLLIQVVNRKNMLNNSLKFSIWILF